MKKILFLTTVLFASSLIGQNSIPNGNFEQWTVTSFENLDNYISESGTALFLLGSTTTSKSSDSQNGNSSVRLETKTNGSDTLFGFFTSGDFDNSNGFPYSQKPDSIVGYYKSNVLPGDTAIMVLRFSQLGTIYNFQVKYFTGVQSSWTRFAFPLNLSLTPDSMFIAAASSNAINEIGVQPGSWLMLDNLSFTGPGITQPILNGDFENWTTFSYENPDDWSTTNIRGSNVGQLSVTKTTDNVEGSFALRLETVKIFDDTTGFMTNGVFGEDSLLGGQPFNIVFDTLVGSYKYSPIGLDSGAIGLSFFKNGNQISRNFGFFTASSTYRTFEIPFVLPQIPDTLRIDIISSINEAFLGSTLFLDNLILKSIITGVDKEVEAIQKVELFPNPANDAINLSLMNNSIQAEISIVDNMGRLYKSEEIEFGEVNMSINISDLKSGIYYLRIANKKDVIYRSFIKN